LDFASTHGADLSKALMESAVPDQQDVATIENLLAAHSRWAETEGKEGRPADLADRDLRHIPSFSRYTLTALIAPGALLYGANLEGASLQGSNLAGCDLRSARLGGADLRGVNFSGASSTMPTCATPSWGRC